MVPWCSAVANDPRPGVTVVALCWSNEVATKEGRRMPIITVDPTGEEIYLPEGETVLGGRA